MMKPICILVVTMVAMSAPASMDNPRVMSRRGGEAAVPGLQSAVSIARDDIDVPTIRAESIIDAVRAQGFVHAQERFFQMDLARRYAAGELAAVAGPTLLASDRQMRTYRLRIVARTILERATDEQRELLAAYADGVNAGLADLPTSPLEYTFLRRTPQEWSAEDSVLVMLSLTEALHFSARFEEMVAVMADALPRELVDFLTPSTTRFDVPLLSDVGTGVNDYVPMPIPGPDVLDLRTPGAVVWAPDDRAWLGSGIETAIPGSNNWAVSGARTTDGRAIVANDPHLMLSAPIIWFRIEIETPDTTLRGVSLPGVPLIVIGSNEHVAWGFTNTTADYQDLIVVEVDPNDTDRYRTADGYEPFEIVKEQIEVSGGESVSLDIRMTRWGPVDRLDHHDRPIVLKWVGREPDMFNLDLFAMRGARTLEDAVEVARRWRGPSQNAVIASSDGRIAWVMTGYQPKRRGFSGKRPVSWAESDRGWNGEKPESERPVLIDPPDGILYTANNRTVERARADSFSDFWDDGLRASRIAERLRESAVLNERDLLELQLDTRLVLLDFYRDLALDVLGERSDAEAVELREIVESWNGRADADQHAVPLLDRFRRMVHYYAVDPLVAPCRELSPGFRFSWLMDEEPIRRMLDERPLHLLAPRFDTWDALIEEAFDSSVRRLRAEHAGAIPTWGEINITRIEHPAASVAGAMGAMLNMPPQPQSGHFSAVRVATPSFGASMRMVVSPGREKDGILHIPTGQSGHPPSPHYRSSHSAWLNGEPTSFRAGDAASTVTLVPGPADPTR